MTDVDILIQEVQAREPFVRGSSIGYDDDPNSVSAPPALANAPLGTWYHRPTLDIFYRKNAAGTWIESGTGGGGTPTAPPVAVVQEDIEVTVDPSDVNAVDLPIGVVFQTQAQADAATGGNPIRLVQMALNACPLILEGGDYTINVAAGDHELDLTNESNVEVPLGSTAFGLQMVERLSLNAKKVRILGAPFSTWNAIDPSVDQVAGVLNNGAEGEGRIYDFSPIDPLIFQTLDPVGSFLRLDGESDDSFSTALTVFRKVDDARILIPTSSGAAIPGTVSLVRPSTRFVFTNNTGTAVQFSGSSDVYDCQNIHVTATSPDSTSSIANFGGRWEWRNSIFDVSQAAATEDQFDRGAVFTANLTGTARHFLFNCIILGNAAGTFRPIEARAGSEPQTRFTVIYNFGAGALVRSITGSSEFGTCCFNNVGNANVPPAFGDGRAPLYTAALAIEQTQFARFLDFGGFATCYFANLPNEAIYFGKGSNGPLGSGFGEDVTFVDVAGPCIAIGDGVVADFTGGVQNWEVINCADVGIEFLGQNSVVITQDEMNLQADLGYCRFRDGDIALTVADLGPIDGEGLRDAFGNAIERLANP